MKPAVSDARSLIELVVDRFPVLVTDGDRLISAAVRYSQAVQDFIGRLLDEATAHRDFSMLDPEQYLAATLQRQKEELAGTFRTVLFDPASPFVTPEEVAKAVDDLRPRPARRRPPRPIDPEPGEDPLSLAKARAERNRERRTIVAEEALDGRQSADVTAALRFAGWPAAASAASSNVG